MWRDSLTLWREAPVFGVGVGDFERETERLVAEGRSGSTVVFGHAHSIYFDALATTGTVGFAAMLWFAFGRPFRIGWSAWRGAATPWQTFYAVGIMLAVVGFLVFGLTEAWFSRNPMVRTYLMCLLIMMAGLAGGQGVADRSQRPA
jgi:O-antigen ligase